MSNFTFFFSRKIASLNISEILSSFAFFGSTFHVISCLHDFTFLLQHTPRAEILLLLLELGGEKDAPPGSCQTFEDTDRSPYFWTGQFCALSPNCFLFSECEHPFIDWSMVITEPNVTSTRPLGLGSKLYLSNMPRMSCHAESFMTTPKSSRVRQGAPSPKKIFSVLRAFIWSKIKGGGGAGEAPGPLPWIRHWG